MTKAQPQTSSMRTILRLWQQARIYRWHLAAILGINLLSTPLSLLAPIPMKIVVDNVVGDQPLPDYLARFAPDVAVSSSHYLLVAAILLMLAIAVASQVRSLCSGLLRAFTAEHLVLNFRAQLFRHAQRLSFSYHDRKGTMDSTYRIQFDANSPQHIFIDTGIPFVTSSFSLIGIVGVTLLIDRQLTIIALLAAPILAGLIRLYGNPLKKKWRLVSKLDSESISIVQETLSALRVVKAFGRETDQEERFVNRSQRKIAVRLDAARARAVFGGLTGLTITLATASVLYVGTLHVQTGILTIGELLMIMAYIGQLFGPLRKMTQGSAALTRSLTKAERVFDILDLEPDVLDKPHAKPIVRARGRLEFENVTFSYRDNNPALRNVSFKVEPGTRVGIRGETGAGKTTLASLLMRFYDPDSGRILLDGVDLRDYNLKDLRNQFAMVLQEPILFSVTLRENIAYARPGATDAEVHQAAELANIHDFISNLEEGYETDVGERGMMLSGGERQRVALARAFLKDAPILILDEPTSAVDTATETEIMDAMDRLMAGRTTFMIAHRLTTLANCDLQVEIADGKLRVLPSTLVASS